MTATGTGFFIPEPPILPADAAVLNKTADYTLVVADLLKIITNTGDVNALVLTLPAAADAAGMTLHVQLTAAQTVELLPVTGEKIFLGGDGEASKYLLIAAVIGNYAKVYSDGVSWLVFDYNGVVTKEA
jgi:hypothetical protein